MQARCQIGRPFTFPSPSRATTHSPRSDWLPERTSPTVDPTSSCQALSSSLSRSQHSDEIRAHSRAEPMHEFAERDIWRQTCFTFGRGRVQGLLLRRGGSSCEAVSRTAKSHWQRQPSLGSFFLPGLCCGNTAPNSPASSYRKQSSQYKKSSTPVWQLDRMADRTEDSRAAQREDLRRAYAHP